MKHQLLLLEDVDSLGRKGELVSVKPGYSRNFLIPQKKALVAHPNILKMQQRLKEEREKQAAVDLKESQKLKDELASVVLRIEVKIDPEGNLYGSVSAADIIELFHAQGFKQMEKRWIKLSKPIKELGSHPVALLLKEGVEARVHLEVEPEAGVIPIKKGKKTAQDEIKEKKEEMKEIEDLADDAKE